jgi:hypothetical protein
MTENDEDDEDDEDERYYTQKTAPGPVLTCLYLVVMAVVFALVMGGLLYLSGRR